MNTIMTCKEIFCKQRTDIMRNKQQMIIMCVFPIMALLYSLIEQEASAFYLFMLMNSIMTPITSISSTVSEEKEKGTLRSLFYAGVNSYEYFAGVGFCIGLLSYISVCIVGIVSAGRDISTLAMAVLGVSVILSLLIGSLIGVVIKRQVNVAAVSAPCSMLLGMLPVIGGNSASIHNITKYLYSQVILDVVLADSIDIQQIVILIVNGIVIFTLFVIMYSKSFRKS